MGKIEKKLKTKLKHLMYVSAQRKKEKDVEYFKYDHFEVYINPSLDNFLQLLKQGEIYIDFDARTGHNHGTKFRIKSSQKRNLYQYQLSVS